ncbi:zinc-ribbon domain-containing protein [Bifidobacterium olomucense]|nr:zinc-ribbon domain-containing protein [Bifidobacterium sp. DSM 109959]
MTVLFVAVFSMLPSVCFAPTVWASEDANAQSQEIDLPDAMTPDDMNKLYDNGNQSVALMSPSIYASDDSRYLYYLSRSKQGVMNVFDTKDGKQIDALKIYDGEPDGFNMKISPSDASQLAIFAETGNDAHSTIQYTSVDLNQHKATRYANIDGTGNELAVGASSDGATLYIAQSGDQDDDWSLDIIDATSGKTTSSIDFSNSLPMGIVAVLDNGKRILTYDADGYDVFDIDTGDILHHIDNPGQNAYFLPLTTAISPNGKTFYVSTYESDGGSVRAYDISNGTEIQRYPAIVTSNTALRVTPDGKSLILPITGKKNFSGPIDSVQLLDLKSGDMNPMLTDPPEESAGASLQSVGIVADADCTHLLLRVGQTVTMWPTGLKSASKNTSAESKANPSPQVPWIPIIAAGAVGVLAIAIIVALVIRKHQHHPSPVPATAPVAAMPARSLPTPVAMAPAPQPQIPMPTPASSTIPSVPLPSYGNDTQQSEFAAPTSQQSNASQSKYCTQCGNPVAPGTRFCSNCGAPTAS